LGFILFFSIVICLNIYDWWKLRQGFLQQRPGAATALLIAVLIMALLPLLLRLIFRGHGAAPRALELLSWFWLAWSFWLATAFLLTDLWDFALLSWRLWPAHAAKADSAHNIMRYCFTPRAAACSALGFVAFATIWGSIEARLIRIKEIPIISDKIPAAAEGFRLLQLSDVHIGASMDSYMLKRIIRLAHAAQPDVLVSTGDLIDGNGEREHRLASALAAASAPKGNYAVLGNHEAYNGLEHSIRLHEDAKMSLLRQEHAVIDDWLWLYGVDDPAVYGYHGRNNAQEQAFYENLAEAETDQADQAFRILLKHQPKPDAQARSLFDLQLSGHSHGGQIVPFNFVVTLAHRWHPGRLHHFAEGMRLYVSRGSGVWGPPLRFLAAPELTLFVFQRPSADTDALADAGQPGTKPRSPSQAPSQGM
jgi:predicted MPP superfamily phosphohydrolase